MTRRRRARCSVLLLGAVLLAAPLAACGDDEQDAGADGTEAPAGGDGEPSISEVSACVADGQTLLVAAEAFFAMNGGYPTSMQDLADEQLIRPEAEFGYDLVVGDDGLPSLDATAPACEGILPGTEEWSMGEGAIDSGSGGDTGQDPCAVEQRTLEVAAEAYFAETGEPPAGEADLVPLYLRADAEGYDIVDGVVIPTPGGPCD